MKNSSRTFIALLFTFGFFFTSKAQSESVKNLNNYKYVVIPMQFSFQKEENEFLINSRVKHLLDELNFNTVMEDRKYPKDLSFNHCLALYAKVKSESEGFFSIVTKLRVILKNCRNEVVFKSKIGKSKTKDYEEAYKEALQDAFTSFSGVYYHYNGGNGFVEEDQGKQQPADERAKKSPKSEDPLENLTDKTYMLNGDTFTIFKIKAGYLMKNKKTGERVALLNVTENNSILYNSDKINGTATVGKAGDLTVEYFDKMAGKLKKLVYHEKAVK